eukprot:scaffold345_cov44-Attheya_sp.AAC.4
MIGCDSVTSLTWIAWYTPLIWHNVPTGIFLAVDGTTKLGHAFHLEAPRALEDQKQDEIDFS